MSERDLTKAELHPKAGAYGAHSVQPILEDGEMTGKKAAQMWRQPPNPKARRFVLSRAELIAICWNLHLHLDRNGEYVFPEHLGSEQFDAALDEAVAFAIRCAVIGLAP